MGIKIEERFLHTLLFADDQVVIAGDEFDTQYLMRKLTETFEKWGLKINYDKTKYLVAGGDAVAGKDVKDLVVDNKIIKGCEEVKYLGVVLSRKGNSEQEITERITNARKVISQLNTLLWSETLSLRTKRMMNNAILRSVLMYGAEAWELTKRNKDRLNAVEMDFLRRSCRVSRIEHIRNEEIRRRMNQQESVVETIESRQLLWYGHVKRMSEARWPKFIMEWTPQERRKRGRPPRKWEQDIQNAMNLRQLNPEDALDRGKWKLRCEKRPDDAVRDLA